MTPKHPGLVLIGFAGPAGSGKTTIAKCVHYTLRERAPLYNVAGAHYDNFARPIRDGLACFGIHHKEHPLFRRAAQTIGTDLFRDYDENWWVNQLIARNTARHNTDIFHSATAVVIDDVRFENEANNCDIVFRIEANEVRAKHGLKGELANHASERFHWFDAGWDRELKRYRQPHWYPLDNPLGDPDAAVEEVLSKLLVILKP